MKSNVMKLELKHLAPYLPYGLKVIRENIFVPDDYLTVYGATKTHIYINTEGNLIKLDKVKLILRPLSDLFIKRFDDENGGLRHIDFISKEIFFDNHVDSETTHESFWHRLINSMIYPTLNQSKELLDFLYKNHYDIKALFNYGKGLIEKGLAIDINTLEK